MRWVAVGERSICPLDKKSLKMITFTNVLGKRKKFYLTRGEGDDSEGSQSYDSEDSDLNMCEVCCRAVPEHEFFTGNRRGFVTAIRCHDCEDMSVHKACMSLIDKKFAAKGLPWLCRFCLITDPKALYRWRYTKGRSNS